MHAAIPADDKPRKQPPCGYGGAVIAAHNGSNRRDVADDLPDQVLVEAREAQSRTGTNAPVLCANLARIGRFGRRAGVESGGAARPIGRVCRVRSRRCRRDVGRRTAIRQQPERRRRGRDAIEVDGHLVTPFRHEPRLGELEVAVDRSTAGRSRERPCPSAISSRFPPVRSKSVRLSTPFVEPRAKNAAKWMLHNRFEPSSTSLARTRSVWSARTPATYPDSDRAVEAIRRRVITIVPATSANGSGAGPALGAGAATGCGGGAGGCAAQDASADRGPPTVSPTTDASRPHLQPIFIHTHALGPALASSAVYGVPARWT